MAGTPKQWDREDVRVLKRVVRSRLAAAAMLPRSPLPHDYMHVEAIRLSKVTPATAEQYLRESFPPGQRRSLLKVINNGRNRDV